MKKQIITRFMVSICLYFLLVEPAWPQLASLYKAEIPFFQFLIPYKKDSLPNMVTVDYQFHPGSCSVKGGKVLDGWFSFAPYGKKFNFFTSSKLKRSEKVYYKNTENGLVSDSIKFNKIIRLALAGKDSTIFTTSDSTIFVFSEKKDILLRLRTMKPVPFYDDLLIVDELTNHDLTFWREIIRHQVGTMNYGLANTSYSQTRTYKLARPVWEWVDYATYKQLRSTDIIYFEWEDKLIRIKSWNDAAERFTIHPYVLDVAKLLKKERPRDIGFGILFSAIEDKMRLLPFYSEIEILLNDGRTLKGSGFIQPFRFDSYAKTGYVHFVGNHEFSLISPLEIKSVKYRKRIYEPVFDDFYKIWYMGFPWEHEGINYRVAEGFYCPEESGFFDEYGDLRFKIFSLKKNGDYKFVESNKLYKALLNEMSF